jgi:hypothetical protein
LTIEHSTPTHKVASKHRTPNIELIPNRLRNPANPVNPVSISPFSLFCNRARQLKELEARLTARLDGHEAARPGRSREGRKGREVNLLIGKKSLRPLHSSREIPLWFRMARKNFHSFGIFFQTQLSEYPFMNSFF